MVLFSTALGGKPPTPFSFSSPTSGITPLHRRLSQMIVGSTCAGEEGAWYCMTNTFQRCASGEWSAVMACAPGTVCEPEGLTYASQPAFGIGSSDTTTTSSSSSSSSSFSVSTSAVDATSRTTTTITTTTTGTTMTTTAIASSAVASTRTSTTVTVTTSVRTTTATTTAITTATATATGEASAGSSGAAGPSAGGNKDDSSDAVNIGGGVTWWKLLAIAAVGLGSTVVL